MVFFVLKIGLIFVKVGLVLIWDVPSRFFGYKVVVKGKIGLRVDLDDPIGFWSYNSSIHSLL